MVIDEKQACEGRVTVCERYGSKLERTWCYGDDWQIQPTWAWPRVARCGIKICTDQCVVGSAGIENVNRLKWMMSASLETFDKRCTLTPLLPPEVSI